VLEWALGRQLARGALGESFSRPLLAALRSPNFSLAAKRIAKDKALSGSMRLVVIERRDAVIVHLTWTEAA
jgi:hypothetical protein